MKKFFKTIRNIILIVILIGALTAGIDYLRMMSGEVPMFNISSYNERKRIQTYQGLFYQASRKISVSTNESLVDSSNMKFLILNYYEIDVPRQFKDVKLSYTVETEVSNECSNSTLYYADKDIKVYTYCLDSIKLNTGTSNKNLITYLKKDNSIIDDIDQKLAYRGLLTDDTTLYFKSRSDDSFTTNGLAMYRCNKENINDVYIGPIDMTFQSDFCTYKDDDFKFMYYITEDERINSDSNIDYNQTEAFYEDETYRYEFDTIKSDLVYIETPAVRGKQATKTPLLAILKDNILTIDELEKKGLKFNKIDKAKEAEELAKKAEEEAKKAEEEASKEETKTE
jgi:hypothetical protein